MQFYSSSNVGFIFLIWLSAMLYLLRFSKAIIHRANIRYSSATLLWINNLFITFVSVVMVLQVMSNFLKYLLMFCSLINLDMQKYLEHFFEQFGEKCIVEQKWKVLGNRLWEANYVMCHRNKIGSSVPEIWFSTNIV